ncbi:MAG: TolC family protein, partial [Schwartzia sp.]|nr:TolC family protein [Schwartzia sp. (in: firmicutes)]
MKSIRKLQKALAALAVAGCMGFAALGAAEAAPIVELTLQESIDMALKNNRTIKESAEDQA